MEDEYEEDELGTLDGKPEGVVYPRLGRTINRRLSANNDYWMAITGPEGSGKSTLAIKIAEGVDENFSVEQNVIVNPNAENVLQKIMHSDVKAIVIDEAVNIAYNREHFRAENIFFSRLSAVCRKKNKMVILCIPRMRSLDSSIRNHRLRSWMFVPERGYAVMMVPNTKNPYCSDPWYLKANEEFVGKKEGRRRIHDINTGSMVEILRHTKTFWFAFRFSKLSELTENKYKSLVAEQGANIVFGKEKKEDTTQIPELKPQIKYKIYGEEQIPPLPPNYRI